MFDWSKIWSFKLTKGASNYPEYGACIMQAIDWLEYGRFSDRPHCVSPVIRDICVIINDVLSEEARQKLINYIPLLIGTTDFDNEKNRLRAAISLYNHECGGLTGNEVTIGGWEPFESIPNSPGYHITSPIGEAMEWLKRWDKGSFSSHGPHFEAIAFRMLDAMLAIGKRGEIIDMPKVTEQAEKFAALRKETIDA